MIEIIADRIRSVRGFCNLFGHRSVRFTLNSVSVPANSLKGTSRAISCLFCTFYFTQHSPILNTGQQQDLALFRAQVRPFHFNFVVIPSDPSGRPCFCGHFISVLEGIQKAARHLRSLASRLSASECKCQALFGDVNAFVSLTQNRTLSFRTCPHWGCFVMT